MIGFAVYTKIARSRGQGIIANDNVIQTLEMKKKLALMFLGAYQHEDWNGV